MIDDTNVAASWLEGLAARGVSVAMRNGRLELRPARAYKELTDAELITLRHHREAIKDAVRAGLPVMVTAPTDAEGVVPTPEPAPLPEPDCPYCHRKCIGREHHAYEVMHWADSAEIAKRRQKATSEMLESMRRARRGEIPQW